MPPPAMKLKFVLFPALVEFAPINHALPFCKIACVVLVEPSGSKLPRTPEMLKALKMLVVPPVN